MPIIWLFLDCLPWYQNIQTIYNLNILINLNIIVLSIFIKLKNKLRNWEIFKKIIMELIILRIIILNIH